MNTVEINGVVCVTDVEGYRGSLEAAGAIVHEYEQWGSYSGDWRAIVGYQDKTLLVGGGFGSCSGCDSFEAEMDRIYSDGYKKSGYEKEKIINFGKSYLDSPLNIDFEIKQAEKHASWDIESEPMIAWLKAMRDKYGLALPQPGTSQP